MNAILNGKRETLVEPRRQVATLQDRYALLHREMVDQLERTIAGENHWLIYTLLGWEHLVTCTVSYFMVEMARLQFPHRWAYGVLWLAQILIAAATIKLIRGKPKIEESPYKPIVNRLWMIFLLLCCNVAGLNVLAGLPVFTFLPVLATLSSFAFLVLACFLSRSFLWAALVTFISGIFMARFPEIGFLIYGGSWLLILQALGIIFLLRRKRFLPLPETIIPGKTRSPAAVPMIGLFQ
jgi:hypothetical protein